VSIDWYRIWLLLTHDTASSVAWGCSSGGPLLAIVEAAWRSLLTGSEESEGC